MIRLTALLVPAVLLGPALAQKADLKVEPAKDQAQRFTIQTKIQTNQTNKMLVNGEEFTGGAGGGGGGGGRGAGGGGGESQVSQEVVFDEGPADANWRHYRKLISTETRAGQDQPRETKGSLEGKKVTLKAGENGAVVLAEGEGDQAKPVDAALSRGVPGRMSLAGFVPGKAVAVGEEFDLSKTFAATLRNLAHPVTADAGAGGGQGGRGQGGGGAQGGGGDQGGGQGGRGQGGGGRGGMGRGGAGSTVSQLITGGKLNAAITGKLTAIEKQDGADIAVIAVTGKMTGKGTGEELGLSAPGGFGGGGRGARGQGGAGGGQANAAGTDKADATFDITGKIRVNLATHQVTAVDLDGNVTVARESHNTVPGRDGGEERKIDNTSNTKGKFQLVVRCEPAKADSKETKETKQDK